MAPRLAILTVLALGACGRVGFDDQQLAGDGSVPGDTTAIDVPIGMPFTISISGRSAVVGVAAMPDGGAVVVGSAQGPTMFGTEPLLGRGGDDVLIAAVSAIGTVRWAKLHGGPQDDRALAVAADGDGTIYVTGVVNGTAVDLGGGSLPTVGNDVFVASYTPNGDHKWSRHFGGGDLATGYITDVGSAIALAANGDIIVGGSLAQAVDLGNGVMAPGSTAESDAFVARFASSSTALWLRRWGVTGQNSVDDVAVSSTGAVFAAGVYSGTPDLGTGPVPSRGGFDAFVIGMTEGGTDRWNVNFGGSNNDRLYGLEVVDGTVIASGYYWDTIDLGAVPVSAGQADGVVVGYSTDGAYQFARRYGGIGCDFIPGSGTVDGKAAIAGTFSGPIDLGAGPLTPYGGTDSIVFLTKDGNVGWSEGFGGAGDEIAFGAAGGLDTGVFVVGASDVAFDAGCYGTATNGYVKRL